MLKHVTLRLVPLAILAGGCEAPELPAAATSAPAAAPAEEPVIMVAGAPGEALPEIETPVTDTPRKFNSHDPIKGRRSRDAGGMLGAAGGARFHIEFQTIINNIDHALQLWHAEHGEYPKSHEEFWKVIIEANGQSTRLPELEPHHEYIYVPEQAEVGLQIRLKPGSPGSSLPAAPPAGEQPPAEQAAGEAPAEGDDAASGATDGAAAEPAAEELSPNIRERAGQIGGQANSRTEEAAAGGP